MFNEMLENTRKFRPLIHCITNYVTVNDCANLLLACGASPIMSDDVAEVEEITSICSGLDLNIGTLNHQTIPSMFLAGKKANTLNHPVILDPVGAGASRFRTETALRLLEEVKFTVVRGNSSEIKALACGNGSTKGVDADLADQVTDENLTDAIAYVQDFAKKLHCVVALTGAIDLVADAKAVYIIRNGHAMMSQITGSGCMLTALIAAYLAANPDHALEATAAAVSAMGLCGELAYARYLRHPAGNASYRDYLIDAIYQLNGNQLKSGAKYELR